MPPTFLAHVYLYAMGRPEPGLWCESCLLPSAIGYRFLLLGARGTVLRRGRMVHCHDCGKQWDPTKEQSE